MKKKKRNCYCWMDLFICLIFCHEKAVSLYWYKAFLNIGGHELPAKEHRWIQYWQHFTWFFRRGGKLCTNGCAIYRSRFIITSSTNDICSFITSFMLNCVSNLCTFPGSWVNFYGNIGKTLLSLVWIHS